MVDHHHSATVEISEKERIIVANPAGFCTEIETTNDLFNSVVAAASYLKKTLNTERVDVGVIFGSGHLSLAYEVENPQIVKYIDIPYFPISTNIGHGRELVYGQIHGKNVILFTGRIHIFEGYRSYYLTFMGQLCAFLGCQLLISTNSCGGISNQLKVGDFVIMSDGLNCSYIPYLNATIYDKKFSTKQHSDIQKSGSFVYDPELIEFARNCGKEVGLDLLDGCYSVWPLPNFETAADIQFTKEIGSLVSGASTVPEQTAATFLGVKCIGFAAVTNPATGTSDGNHVHDGESNLMAAKKCLLGLRKTIWKVIEKFSFTPDYKFTYSLECFDQQSTPLQVRKISKQVDLDKMRNSIVQKVKSWVSHEPGHSIGKCVWIMSDQIFKEYMATVYHTIHDLIYINFKSVGTLRTRSFEDAQFVLFRVDNINHLIVRQPHLEGMMSFEYSFILKVLKDLGVNTFTTYIEALSVNDYDFKGKICEVGSYFNKRFYKFTEDSLSHLDDIQFPRKKESHQVSLFGFEGPLLPTYTELNQAIKGSFSIYTITNISLFELATYHGFNLKHYATVRDPEIKQINPELFEKLHKQELLNEVEKDLNKIIEVNQRTTSDFVDQLLTKAHLKIEVEHSWESISSASAQIKELLGTIDNCMVFDREIANAALEHHSGILNLEKIVQLTLTDYPNQKKVLIISGTLSKDQQIVFISDTLNYQSHVPYQSLMLPIRSVILGCDVRNFIVCPKIWTLNETEAKVGDVFIVNDHANLSAHSPGVGVNLNEYGARFYDCSQTYDKDITTKLVSQTQQTNSHSNSILGTVFWTNNSTIPSDAIEQLAYGLSNEKVRFNGLVKSGLAELLAVQHRKTKETRFKLRSAMIGVVTDSILRDQKLSAEFKMGVVVATQAAIAAIIDCCTEENRQ